MINARWTGFLYSVSIFYREESEWYQSGILGSESKLSLLWALEKQVLALSKTPPSSHSVTQTLLCHLIGCEQHVLCL